MSEVNVFLAEGFEEIEAITIIDFLRRAGIPTTTVSISNSLSVCGAHNMTLEADILFREARFDQTRMLVFPGGMPGALNLYNDEKLRRLTMDFYNGGKYLAAICAAPFILGQLGLLQGRKATCYPGFEERLTGALLQRKAVVADGPFITANGPGAAMAFAHQIVATLCDRRAADDVCEGMMQQAF